MIILARLKLSFRLSHVLGILFLILLTVPIHAGEQLVVKPITRGFDPPLRPNPKILASLPPGWRLLDTPYGAGITFIPAGDAFDSRNAELSVYASVSGRLGKIKASYVDPRGTLSMTYLKSAARPSEIKKIGSFDAGRHGKLPIWLIRSPAYDFYLVMIVEEDLSIEIQLRAEDADQVVRYLDDLKLLVRSISIERKHE